MAIDYSWRFTKCDVQTIGNMVDVVRVVRWKRIGVENGVKAAVYGSTELPLPNPQTFVPFNQLTRATFRQWLGTALSNTQRAAIDAEVAAKIAGTAQDAGVRTVQPPWSD